jgi:Mlc titration factor MtfA (ptsG expression regulator)
MLPTARRIRATRRWAVIAAILVAVPPTLLLLVMCSGMMAKLAVALAGLVLGLGMYVRESRIIRSRLHAMRQPFPQAWDAILRHSVRYYASLEAEERERFQHLMQIFLAEKPIIGIGCVVDDTCRLLVAASAIIPIYAFPAWEYDMLRKVLIRPEAFDPAFDRRFPPSFFAEGMVSGSGLFHGVMIISQPALLSGFAHPGEKHNVGIHEFAHLIDFAKGHFDGVPATLPREYLRPWTTLVHEELTQHTSETTGMPGYGFSSETEFFAVASEYFFEAPEEMALRDPRLYALLERAFGQDMRSRSLRMSWWRREEPTSKDSLAVP